MRNQRIRHRPWPVDAALATVLACVVALAASAGGSGALRDAARAVPQSTAKSSSASLTKLTLMLDFIPNPVHVGVYRAVKAGYYKQANIDLRIVQPTSSADYSRLVAAGKADIGMADGVDLLTFIDKGTKYRAFLATLQTPLAGIGVLKSSGIKTPKQLEGKKVGTPGSPSNKAFLVTMVKASGGDPNKVKLITTGFDFVKFLVGGKIDGFTGYMTDAVQGGVESGKPIRFMRLDRYGGPRYPSLVFYATQERIAKDPSLIRGFAAATARGYEDTLRNSALGLSALLGLNKALKAAPARAQLKAIVPLFRHGAKQYGRLNLSDLTKLSAFLVKHGLIKHAVSGNQAATNAFLPHR